MFQRLVPLWRGKGRRRIGAGARRVLVGAHDGGVHRDVPVGLAGRVGRSLNPLQQTLPGAVGRPEPMAFVDRLPRPEPVWQIAPVHPGPHPVQNPVDHLPVITPPPAPTVAHRQKRSQPLPLGVRQITAFTPPHTRNNEQIGGRPPRFDPVDYRESRGRVRDQPAQETPRRRHAVRQTRGPLRGDCPRCCHQRVAVNLGCHTAVSTFHVSGRSLPQKTQKKSSSRTMLCSWQSGHRRNTTSWVKPEGRSSPTSSRA